MGARASGPRPRGRDEATARSPPQHRPRARATRAWWPALPRCSHSAPGEAVAWAQLANVHTLYLSGCELGAPGIERFLAGARLDKLATLTLSQNALGDEGAAVLVKHAAQLPALEHIELAKIPLPDSLHPWVDLAVSPDDRYVAVTVPGATDEIHVIDAVGAVRTLHAGPMPGATTPKDSGDVPNSAKWARTSPDGKWLGANMLDVVIDVQMLERMKRRFDGNSLRARHRNLEVPKVFSTPSAGFSNCRIHRE